MGCCIRVLEVTRLTEQFKDKYLSEINTIFNYIKDAEGGTMLSVKHKELINAALSMARQCE